MRIKLIALLSAALVALGLLQLTAASGADAYGPDLRVSADGHHLEKADGTPFFWMADTSYIMGCKATREDVDDYLTARKNQGFDVVKLYVNVNRECTPNRYGASFSNADGTPNDAYFQFVDEIVGRAAQRGLYVLLVLYQVDAAESAYLGQRYRTSTNVLFWAQQPSNTANIEAVGRALSGHPGLRADQADPAWSRILLGTYVDQSEAWGDVPWAAIRTFTGTDNAEGLYDRTPAKPVVWSDGHYEGGVCENGDSDSPNGLNYKSGFGIRRAAWIGFVRDGAFATYGCPDTWDFASHPEWRQYVESPGATALSRFKTYWTARSWWRLRPDTSIMTNVASADEVTRSQSGASRSLDGNAVYAYFAGAASASVDLSSITTAATATARWFDPATGTTRDAGSVATGGPATFTTPAGWQDALLEVTATGGATAAPAATPADTAPSASPSPGESGEDHDQPGDETGTEQAEDGA